MKIVENPFSALFDYIVNGVSNESEEAAAKELEEKLNRIDRLGYNCAYVSIEIEDARKSVSEKYGVIITTT